MERSYLELLASEKLCSCLDHLRDMFDEMSDSELWDIVRGDAITCVCCADGELFEVA